MPRLLIETPGNEPLVYELVKPRVSIGRSERNDLVLNDLNASRFHASLELGPEGYRIVDHNSRNGVYVGNRRCGEAVLENGSVVRLGDTVLTFEESSPAWDAVTLVQRAGPAVAELAIGDEESGLLRATDSLRHISARFAAAETTEDLKRQLQEARRRALLFELVGRARRIFQEASGPQEVLSTIPKLVCGATKAERVVVMLWDEQKQCLQPAGIHAPGQQSSGMADLALSRTILNTVLQSRKGVLIRDVKAEPELLLKESIMLSGLRSAVCVPMATQEKLYGLIYVDNRHTPQVFDEDDVEMLGILSQEGALALLTAQAREEQLKQERVRQAYRRYLPEHVAEMLVAHPEAVKLGGARQVVTVLFSDLRGFTSLSERLEPEDAVSLLNSFFTEMTLIVFRHGGTLDKYLGDGLLAVFGAPIADPSDPVRAVQCAIDMQEALDEFTAEWQAQNRPTIPMGIGINTGDVIAGNIGSQLHMEYTVIGDTVNVAARLTQHAGAGEILLGEQTFREIQGREQISAESLPPLTLKGKREPAIVYRVVRSKAAGAAAGG
jgi:adenylate cyclase